MREVVACARFAEAPPPILVMAWDVDRWHTLPDAGGLLDQDYHTLQQMRIALNIYQMITKLHNLKGEQIHSLSEGERAFIKALMDMGVFYG